MKGSHRVIVETERIKYEFTIRRNITVVLGDSATGKTTLVDFLGMYSRNGKGSGVSVESDVPVTVYGSISGHWRGALSEIHESIIFIDEGQPFIFSQDFAEYLGSSDNYFVLITRRPIHNLPYSTKEIYGIRTTGKYHFPEKVYQEFYPIYAEETNPAENRPVLILEDTGSGYEFFQKGFPRLKCIGAGGHSKVVSTLSNLSKEDSVLVIADGAAFGAYIENLISIKATRDNIGVYLPESFEWLILRSGIIEKTEINKILEHPENCIDSSAYISWERYFTELLEKETADDPRMRYSKSGIRDYYLSGKNIQKVLDIMPEEIQKCLK